MKSLDVTRAITAMILATNYLRGRRHDDLSVLSRARQILMKRLLPLLGQAAVKLQNRREKLRRSKENGCSLNSEVAPERLPAPSRPSLDEASRGPTSSGPALARAREGVNKFLDDFEKELWERTRSPPKARTLPELPSEGGDRFLDDLEEAVQRFILEQDQKGLGSINSGRRKSAHQAN